MDSIAVFVGFGLFQGHTLAAYPAEMNWVGSDHSVSCARAVHQVAQETDAHKGGGRLCLDESGLSRDLRTNVRQNAPTAGMPAGYTLHLIDGELKFGEK